MATTDNDVSDSPWQEAVQTNYENQEWHGTKIIARTESGVEIRAGDTPGNRELYIKHPAGSYIHINDTGQVSFKSNDTHTEIDLKNRRIKVDGRMDMTVKNDLTIRSEKKLILEGKSVSIKAAGGNIDLNASEGITQESKNWGTNTTKAVNHRNGGNYGLTIGGDNNVTITGKMQFASKEKSETVAGDSTTMTGGEHSLTSGKTMGFGATKIGFGATSQIAGKAPSITWTS